MLTPVLLKMIRDLSENELLEGLNNRAEIYSQWFKYLLLQENPNSDDKNLEKCIDQLGEIAYQQVAQGKIQRFQKEEPGYDKRDIDKDKFDLLIQEDDMQPRWNGVIQQTP